MNEQPQLHSVIVSMVSLAAGIASRHPDMGRCQLDRLRQAGVPEHQIDAVIEIARHIRDEASEKFDAAFIEEASVQAPQAEKAVLPLPTLSVTVGDSCCTPTPSGQSCC